MDRRFIAMAAGFAALMLGGVSPAAASQCTAACDKTFSACNGSNPDTSVCLPKWGQCKRSCAAPSAASTPAKAAPAAKVTPVASKGKPASATKSAKPVTVAAAVPAKK